MYLCNQNALKPEPIMRKFLLCIVCLLTASCLQSFGQTKAEIIKEIRQLYAEAKKKVDLNGKNGNSPKDMRIVLNRAEDEDIPLYDMEQLDFYFEQYPSEDGVVTKPPYFIVEDWGNHGHLRYREVLLNPKTHKVIFCYTRGETDAGFVLESRCYYDAEGRCIEEKTSSPNSWYSPASEKETAETYLKIFDMTMNRGGNDLQDTNMPKKETAPKAERLKHIRTLYAQAKDQSAANDKKDMSDDLHITIHDLGDDQPPRTIETRIYFDKAGIYFINSHSTSMQFNAYNEYLFEPKTQDLIFSYTRAAEEGEVYEWRYYFDENSDCIETKTNSPDNADESISDKRHAKYYQSLYQEISDKLGS